jgi:predicted nucleotidyltransferase
VGRGELSEREDRQRFGEVLREAVEVVKGEGVPYAVFGSIASVTWGRPSSAGDVDILLQPQDAPRVLKAFDRAGFDTEETDPGWLLKAVKDGVLVDLIHKIRGDIYLDDEMIRRSVQGEYLGSRFRLIAPEDSLLIEAMGTESETPEHWFNALAIIAQRELDWDYVLHRARTGTRRMLALLIYAQSTDLPVPDAVVRALYDTIYAEESST